MRGLSILLGFHFAGMLLKTWLQIPLPANVIGLILFTVCLFLDVIRLEWVEVPAEWLTKHMMLFFAPYIVGTIAFWPVIKQYWLSVVVGLVASSLVTMFITGWMTQRLANERKEASR